MNTTLATVAAALGINAAALVGVGFVYGSPVGILAIPNLILLIFVLFSIEDQ